jgi:hypothetical protein
MYFMYGAVVAATLIVFTWLAVEIAVCVAPVMSAAPVPLPSDALWSFPTKLPVIAPE